MTKLTAYIHFKDNAKQAMEFYKTVFGGNLTMSTFKEGGVPCDPSEENQIMHAELIADNGIDFMGADTPSHMNYNPGSTITMTLSGENEEELTGYWNKLAEGATVNQPLTKAPWGDTFGMLTDKFGIEWMVNISVIK